MIQQNTQRENHKEMKKLINLLLLLPLFIACNEKAADNLPCYSTIEDFYNKSIAIISGSSQEQKIAKMHPEINILRFDFNSDVFQSIISKQSEAVILEEGIYWFYADELKGLVPIEHPLESNNIGAVFRKGQDTELREAFNKFITELKESGEYDKMRDRWMRSSASISVPEFELVTKGEPIIVATSTTAPPICYIHNSSYAGLDYEIVMRFSQYINRPIKWFDAPFSALIPALIAGKADMLVGGINITEERAKSVDFSIPYDNLKTYIFIREENSPGFKRESEVTKETFSFIGLIDKIKESFYKNVIQEQRYMLILNGLKITTIISILSAILGTILGGIICLMRMSKSSALQTFAKVYVNFMRGMPILVLLMLMFYVVFAQTSLTAISVSIITFALNFAAYVSEMFRSSITSIDRGQKEAGIALGFTQTQTFIHIIMPQAFTRVLPIYKGELISLVKMTSIVGYIAVQDLTKIGDIIRSRTFDAFFPLLLISIIYFALAWAFSALLDYIGRKTK